MAGGHTVFSTHYVCRVLNDYGVSMSEPLYWKNRGSIGQTEEKWVRSLDGRKWGKKEDSVLGTHT